MKKKWIAGLLALCMCFSTVGFVGCGDKNDTDDNGGNTEQGGNDTTTPEQDGDDTTGDNENQEGENNDDTEQGTNTNPPEQGGNNDDNQQDNENNQQGGDTTTGDTTPPDTPTPEPEITYVTVGDIVEEILGDIDVEADIQEVVEAIIYTRAPTYILGEIFAVDFYDNTLTFYTKGGVTDYSTTLRYFSIPCSNDTYYNILKNQQLKINEILISKELTQTTQIEKNSSAHNQLIFDLTTLKTNYTTEIENIKAIEKAVIKTNQVFNPNILTTDEMTELGIDDMNAFSYALLENKRGSGYDLVTGFTKDDIIETYVDKAGAPNIFGRTAFNIVTFAKNGIYKTLMGTAVTHSSEAFKKVLNDSSDNLMNTHEALVEFSENVILYDNGSRIN